MYTPTPSRPASTCPTIVGLTMRALTRFAGSPEVRNCQVAPRFSLRKTAASVPANMHGSPNETAFTGPYHGPTIVQGFPQAGPARTAATAMTMQRRAFEEAGARRGIRENTRPTACRRILAPPAPQCGDEYNTPGRALTRPSAAVSVESVSAHDPDRAG